VQEVDKIKDFWSRCFP